MIDLPVLVQLKILRYLDGKSLNNAALLCRSMLNFIRNNRRRLVIREIFKLSIIVIMETRTPCDSPENIITCKVKFHEHQRTDPVHVGNDTYTTSTWGYCGRIWKGSFRCLWEWIAKNCEYTTVSTFTLRNVAFTAEQMDAIDGIFTHNKTCFEEIILVNTLRNKVSLSIMLRFLKMFGNTSLVIRDAPGNICEFLKSRDMGEYLSTLQKFTSANYPEALEDVKTLDLDFCPYPPMFITQNGLITSAETLRKALQNWISGALVLKSWLLLLPPAYDRCSTLAGVLGLPHTLIGESPGASGTGEIVFTNVKGEKCRLANVHVGRQGRSWSLALLQVAHPHKSVYML